MDILLHEYSKDETLIYTIMRYLLFPAIILVIGGIAANILYPRWQDKYLRQKSLNARKFEIGENIFSLVNIYVTTWRRLIEVSSYEKDTYKALNRSRSEERKNELNVKLEDASIRKMEFVKDRGVHRDALMDAVCRFKIYVDIEAQTILDDFVRWDSAQSTKTLEELDIDKWHAWEDRLRSTISRCLLS